MEWSKIENKRRGYGPHSIVESVHLRPTEKLRVSADVWDDVLDELFDEPFGKIPGPFGFLLADLNGKIGPQLLDYFQPEGIFDHDYVRKLLRKSIEELSGNPELPKDDGSHCDKAIEEYWAHCFSLN